MAKKIKKNISASESKILLGVIQKRFEQNMNRHKGLKWTLIQKKLEQQPEKIRSLYELENSGGEPDVVRYDKKNNEFIFMDCAAESPAARRSFCYDREALESRKEHKPKNSALDCAEEMGVELLSEEEYLELQKLGKFDSKTSSWLKTPESIRKLGGAIFADYRFGRVFIYHNGAPSYYASRGFRALLRV